MENLKDIKSIEVLSVNITPYILIISLAFIILIVMFYFFFRKKKVDTRQTIAIKLLKSINFESNHKQIAYDFTIYGQVCAKDEFKDEFINITNQLEKYKYKKDNFELNNTIIDNMKQYIKERF